MLSHGIHRKPMDCAVRWLEVDFTSDVLPRVVPLLASLCLFRVLQEALHNAVKHSGADIQCAIEKEHGMRFILR